MALPSLNDKPYSDLEIGQGLEISKLSETKRELDEWIAKVRRRFVVMETDCLPRVEGGQDSIHENDELDAIG